MSPEVTSPGSQEPIRLGLYGGSFDPIHRGHIEPVLAARRSLDLDRVLYLPTAEPPHKKGRELAPPLRRFTMVELALLQYGQLAVSSFEMESEGPAYTVRTLEHFRRLHPTARLYLIIGADSFAHLHSWYRFADLPSLAELAVMARPGWQPDRSALDPVLIRALDAGRVHVIDNEPLPMSSTVLREHLARGDEPPPDWLPEPVLDYIRKYGLYRGPSTTGEPSGDSK